MTVKGVRWAQVSGRRGCSWTSGKMKWSAEGKVRGSEGSKSWLMQGLKGHTEKLGFNFNYSGRPQSSFMQRNA